MNKTHHLILSGIVLFTASGAFAAEAKKSSLPQMDPTWYPNQLLWLAVSFGVLYAVVSLFIAPSIRRVLDTREHAISDAIAEAERAKREAESTRGTSESAGHDARIRAAEAMAKAQAESSAEAAAAMAKLDAELARKADNAAAVLEDKVAKARAGVEDAARDLASAMADKLLAGTGAADEPKLKLATSR